MFKYLDNLRQKPDSYKKKFSVGVSFCIVLVIFIIWLSVIYPDVINIGKKKSEIRKGPSPTNTFFVNIREGFNSLSGSFDGLSETIRDLTKDIEDSYYIASTSSSTSSTTLKFDEKNAFGSTTPNEVKSENSN